ncbi:Possible alternative RNA polymerase sigma factor SigM [Mycobacteroides abscessus subsp. abscessus]|nr:Possible alternative RNA polymerase sigma factor SigM [Mycobacteroides abscessus subsp. abscessus]
MSQAPSTGTESDVHELIIIGSGPAGYTAAVIAVDMQGYSVADAAELLGVPEGTVKSRCARARARLAVALHYLDKAGSVEPETIDY